MIEAAAGILVRDAGDQAEAVERFVAAVWPMYAAGQERSLPYSDLRTIPTMVLALARPADALAIRYQPLHTAGVRLLHRSLFAKRASDRAGVPRRARDGSGDCGGDARSVGLDTARPVGRSGVHLGDLRERGDGPGRDG